MLATDMLLLTAAVHRPRQGLVAAAVAGAVLAELASAEQVQVTRGGTVVLLDARPTSEAVLDETIARLQRMGPRRLDEVCQVMGRVVTMQVEQALVGEGAIVLDEAGLFGTTLAKKVVVTDRERLRSVQTALADVLTGETAPDTRTGSLIALLRAAGWLTQVVAPTLAARGVRTDVSATARHIAQARWVDDPLLALVADEQGGAAAATVAGA